MPKTTMLLEVYYGVREILWDEYDEDDPSATEGQPNGHVDDADTIICREGGDV
jgi:hypothetical protein